MHLFSRSISVCIFKYLGCQYHHVQHLGNIWAQVHCYSFTVFAGMYEAKLGYAFIKHELMQLLVCLSPSEPKRTELTFFLHLDSAINIKIVPECCTWWYWQFCIHAPIEDKPFPNNSSSSQISGFPCDMSPPHITYADIPGPDDVNPWECRFRKLQINVTLPSASAGKTPLSLT